MKLTILRARGKFIDVFQLYLIDMLLLFKLYIFRNGFSVAYTLPDTLRSADSTTARISVERKLLGRLGNFKVTMVIIIECISEVKHGSAFLGLY